MTVNETRNIALIRNYLAALERGDAGDALRPFFAEDAVQIELPNALNRHGRESDLEHLLQRSQQGSKLLKRQQYQILSVIAHDDNVAVEARWTGVLAIAMGTMAAGTELRASFAMFFQLRGDRIAMQRNYDCFDSW